MTLSPSKVFDVQTSFTSLFEARWQSDNKRSRSSYVYVYWLSGVLGAEDGPAATFLVASLPKASNTEVSASTTGPVRMGDFREVSLPAESRCTLTPSKGRPPG